MDKILKEKLLQYPYSLSRYFMHFFLLSVKINLFIFMMQVAGKQAAFIGLAQYFQSVVCKGNKEIGEEIARLQVSM